MKQSKKQKPLNRLLRGFLNKFAKKNAIKLARFQNGTYLCNINTAIKLLYPRRG